MLHRQCQLQNDMNTSDTNNNSITITPQGNGVVNIDSMGGLVILSKRKHEELLKGTSIPQKKLLSPFEILHRFRDRYNSLLSSTCKLQEAYYNFDSILDNLGLFGIEEFTTYTQNRSISQSESLYNASSVDASLKDLQSKEAIYRSTLSEMVYKYLQSLIQIDCLDESCFGPSFYEKIIDFFRGATTEDLKKSNPSKFAPWNEAKDILGETYAPNTSFELLRYKGNILGSLDAFYTFLTYLDVGVVEPNLKVASLEKARRDAFGCAILMIRSFNEISWIFLNRPVMEVFAETYKYYDEL